jgi:hypothetical protein
VDALPGGVHSEATLLAALAGRWRAAAAAREGAAAVRLTQYKSQTGCVALNSTDAVLSVNVAIGATQCTYVPQLRALAFAACGDSNTTSLAKPAMLPAVREAQ